MKSTFEQKGGTYRKEGDYYLPNLIVPESLVLGIWGNAGGGSGETDH